MSRSGTWCLKKTLRFEASHQLPNHDGKCRRLHGHSWLAILTLKGQHLVKDGPKQGMLIDFSEVSKVCQHLLDNYLDHWHLNESTGLKNPTSEALAEWIFNRLAPPLEAARNDRSIKLVSVTVRETCTCSCTYLPPRVKATTTAPVSVPTRTKHPILESPGTKKGRL